MQNIMPLTRGSPRKWGERERDGDPFPTGGVIADARICPQKRTYLLWRFYPRQLQPLIGF
jgi:hypothetical protein